MIIPKRKTREQIAQLLAALLLPDPVESVYVAWDNAHSGRQVDQVAAAGPLVVLLTYSPWLNPIEMRWGHFPREVTHCEWFAWVKELLIATADFFHRYNQAPEKIRSMIGANSANTP